MSPDTEIRKRLPLSWKSKGGRCTWSHLLLAVAWVLSPLSLAAQGTFETPLTLKASEVLPPDMQRGERFVVREEIQNDGVMNHYRVDSDFGPFEAYGGPALAKLIQEIAALDQLDEVSKSKAFLDALEDSVGGNVKAVQQLVDEPVDTVKGVPDGLKRSFRHLKRSAKEGYHTAKDAGGEAVDQVTGDDAGDDSGSDDSQGLEKQATGAAEAYAKKWFGISAAQLQWHQKLGTDPYTTNEVLQKEIKGIARVTAATDFALKLAPIPSVPGAQQIENLYKVVWTVDPAELREQNIQKLEAAGVDAELIASFMNNPNFSPTMQTVYLDALLSMEGVAGRQVLLEIAARRGSPEEAHFDLENTLLLAAFHKNQEALDHFLPARVGVGVTKDQRMWTMLSIDWAFWDEDFGGAAGAFAEMLAERSASGREVWVRGKASPRVHEEMKRLGWTVRTDAGLSLFPEKQGSSPRS